MAAQLLVLAMMLQGPSSGANSTPAPSGMAVSATGSTSVQLQWHPSGTLSQASDRPASDPGLLTVQRQYVIPSHKGQWFTVAELPGTATEFTVPGLLERLRYTFRVCTGASACCGAVSAVTNAASSSPRGTIIADANSTYPRQGEGTIVRDGKRLLYYYTRFTDGHDVGASAIVYKTSDDDGDSWSAPLPQITPSDGKGRANPGASVLAPGHILLSYFVGANHSSAFRVARHSLDGGATWGAEKLLSDGSYSYMTGAHDRQRVLSNGRIIITIHGRNSSRGQTTSPLYTVVFFSDDKGGSWQRSATPLQVNMTADLNGDAHGFWETALVELTEPGHLLMLGRTCSGWLAESRSYDFGTTWAVPVHNTRLPHPLAPPNLAKLPGGSLLLLTEPHLIPAAGGLLGTRFVIAAQVSHDDGRTWTGYRELQYTGKLHTQDYPSILVDGDTVHISHYRINCTGQCSVQGKRHAQYIKLPASFFLSGGATTDGRF